MKILLCSDFWETKLVGPAHLTQFLMAHKSEDVEIRLLTKDVLVPSEKIYKLNHHANYPPQLYPIYVFYHNIILYRHINRTKKEFDFDILVFVGARNGLLSRLFLNSKIKVVGFINDYFPFFSLKNAKKYSKKWFYWTMLNRMDAWAIRYFDTILACSNDLKKKLVAAHGHSEKIKVFYQGVDVENIIFKERKEPFSKNLKILFVKKLYELGGLEDLAAALQLINFDGTFEVNIIGPSKDEMPKIEKYFPKSGKIKVNIMGYCDEKKVHQAMFENDILCIPSRTESLGIANIEGLATGISVVSTSEGGIPEVMDFGKNGWLAKPKNAISLRDELQNCINSDLSVRNEKSKNGRLFVEKNFNNNLLTSEFMIICREIGLK